MFFNIGAGEMMLIAVALLIAVGPEQLPGLLRKVGSAVGQFRSMSEKLRADFTAGMEELDRATDVKNWAEVPAPDFTGSIQAAGASPPTTDGYDPARGEDGIEPALHGDDDVSAIADADAYHGEGDGPVGWEEE